MSEIHYHSSRRECEMPGMPTKNSVMVGDARKTFSRWTVLWPLALFTVMLAGCRPAQNAEEEWREAGDFIQELSASWKAKDYELAKKLIDAKLSSRPGWLPATILKSSYFRYIEGDSTKAASILQSIEKEVNSLDSEEYAGFIAAYSLYKNAVENEGTFTQEKKEARLELAHEIFTYFPGAEIVAFYFDRVAQQHREDAR